MTTVLQILIEILSDYRNQIIDASIVGFSKPAQSLCLEHMKKFSSGVLRRHPSVQSLE